MASKLANAAGPNGMHTAGIFSDMTVDGPEIGTLVLVIDRAKNLPNRKTMGKQNPYCAARLGKEANKTETDKRGGQTPKWDQELRFTVHDSPDYHNLKVSVFSEDKKTDLIGEAWVSLERVVIPGGGQQDLWQGLSCKGKYAGDIRFELTYYDTRPQPEQVRESLGAEEELRTRSGGAMIGARKQTPVKRRPLPSNPNSGSSSPYVLSDVSRQSPGVARYGPRDLSTPHRQQSLPPEMNYPQAQPGHRQQSLPPEMNYPQAQPGHGHFFGHEHRVHSEQLPYGHSPYSASPPAHPESTPLNQNYDQERQYQQEPSMQPDFLPSLPQNSRQRASMQPQARQMQRTSHMPVSHARPMSHIGLPHSQSAPIVPSSHPEANGYGDYPEIIPDLEYQHQQVRSRRNDTPPGWENPYEVQGVSVVAPRRATVEDDDGAAPPPPPPSHRNSAPAVPQYANHTPPLRQIQSHSHPSPAGSYGRTPPSNRQQYVSDSSPLQSIERGDVHHGYTLPHDYPRRSRSGDDLTPSPQQFSYDDTPSPLVSSPAGQSYSRVPVARPLPHRHSVADVYAAAPPRRHPLAQEVSRARSPEPMYEQQYDDSPQLYGQPMYQPDYRNRDAVPLITPRAVSPQSPREPRQSLYNLQHPVQSFASSQQTPSPAASLDRVSRKPNRSTPTRKSVSPRPSSPHSASAVPFSPDSFDVHNPNASTSPLPGSSSAHSPYQTRPGSEADQREASSGPIVGWDGREIDPSDHLPVDSWAPEPEKKTPTKTYGASPRGFGPRNNQPVASNAGRLSRDTVINVRMKNQPEPPPTEAPPQGRNRLVKKNPRGGNSPIEPLTDHDNLNAAPNPYDQPPSYSRGLRDSSPGIMEGSRIPYDNAYAVDQDRGYGSVGPPNLPPKVPLQQQGYGADALSREISSIDIGPGGAGTSAGRRVPAPTAYVPVKSFRRDFY